MEGEDFHHRRREGEGGEAGKGEFGILPFTTKSSILDAHCEVDYMQTSVLGVAAESLCASAFGRNWERRRRRGPRRKPSVASPCLSPTPVCSSMRKNTLDGAARHTDRRGRVLEQFTTCLLSLLAPFRGLRAFANKAE